MKKGLKSSYLTKLGVFSIFALVTAVSVYIYSPVLGSNASDGIITHINAHFNPTASISTDTDELIFDISPTGPGVFESQPVTVTTSTNSFGGYELYFSSKDDNTDMVHDDETVTDKISSDFSGTVTGESMPANKWGFSLDNTNFSTIPAATNQRVLVNLNHYPASGEEDTTVYVGTKISSTLLSGIYSKDLVFSVLAHDSTLPDSPTGDEHAYSYPSMQDFKPSSLRNTGDSAILRDARDGNLYVVKRLADGKVWMTENLRIIDKTITSADSNLPDGETYTIPASSLSNFSGSDTSAAYYNDANGGFYSHYTATAGWSITSTYGNVSSSQDICPKGWRLPSAQIRDGKNEFQNLYDSYNKSVSSMKENLGLTNSGYVYRDYVKSSSGRYWTSTVSSSYAFYLYIDQGVHTSEYNSRTYGYSIRCVYGERTLSDINFLQEMSPGIAMATSENTTVTLKDTRDNNDYSVKKLEDGNIWMLTPLGISGKTLTSKDSNLPSGETWTLPNSSRTGFSEYNTNNVYNNYSSGVFYTFYSATAGWGTDSVTSGNSPKDICPRGWRLPTGGESGEFSTLYNRYNSLYLLESTLKLDYGGYMNNGSLKNNYSSGHYWSSTVKSANDAYKLYIDRSSVNAEDYGTKFDGYSIRCIVK